MLWFELGFVGWACMMIFRIIIDKGIQRHTFMSYVRGFLFALALGPLTFLFLGFGIVGRAIVLKKLKEKGLEDVFKNQG